MSGDDRPHVRWPLFWLSLLCLTATWSLLAIRWSEPGRPLVIAAAGLLPLLATAPMIIGSLAAWLSRSVPLRLVGAVTVILFLVTTSPLDAVIGCRAADPPAGGAADGLVRLYTANVFADTASARVDAVAAAVAAENPDVLVLQEVTGDFLAGIRVDSRLDFLPHRSDTVSGVPWGEVVWSRWPIVEVEIQPLAGIELIHATIDGPTGRFITTAIHTGAPITGGLVGPWQRQLAGIAAIDRSVGPRILAGDFNATRDHRPFRAVLANGWTDAHEAKGCGFDATWPAAGGLPFAVMRLDHVVVDEDWEVLDLRLGTEVGSDHLPVITDLVLAPAET
ncbi:MAG: endonuclease/exonuclease/phosphatase family protein [Actinomycetota bacterium]